MDRECPSILGKVFGHKFIDVVGKKYDHCLRCGAEAVKS